MTFPCVMRIPLLIIPAPYSINNTHLILSLGAKERDLELIRVENTKIQYKNMTPPSQKLGTARATSHTVVPTLRMPFAAFCFMDKLPISLFLT
ncbi:hypothetical protein MTR_1g037410 [Medicago truncatula]|uniref:Uncharacterized protein n=1 Tax=Medicago truncatula TaxID=3880 RepID=A0A072VH47_MEDTR|nr:hypothetical protein MTR_1g037410 [Medicago truncatula]